MPISFELFLDLSAETQFLTKEQMLGKPLTVHYIIILRSIGAKRLIMDTISA